MRFSRYKEDDRFQFFMMHESSVFNFGVDMVNGSKKNNFQMDTEWIINIKCFNVKMQKAGGKIENKWKEFIFTK